MIAVDMPGAGQSPVKADVSSEQASHTQKSHASEAQLCRAALCTTITQRIIFLDIFADAVLKPLSYYRGEVQNKFISTASSSGTSRNVAVLKDNGFAEVRR